MAKVTSDISSSPKVNAWTGVVAGDGMPAKDSLVVAAVVAAKEIPARPKTDKAFLDRLPLARFNCDMGSSIPIRI